MGAIRLVVGMVLATAAAIGLLRANHAVAQTGLPLGIIARGPFIEPTDLRFKTHRDREEVTVVNNSYDVVVRVTRLAPGTNTGWHTHPGPAVVVVNSGTLSLYSGEDPDCQGRVYGPRAAFVDTGQGHVHTGRNEGTDPVELVTTFFDVPPGAGPTIPAADPQNCNF